MNKKKYVIKLCIASMLSALYVALELLSSTIGKIAFLDNYQLPISCFPLILASTMLGPLWGIGVGIIGSFISQLLSYGLTWSTPVWMVPTICYSALIAVLYLLFKKSTKSYILIIEFIISGFVLSSLNLLAQYFDINVLGVNYYMVFGKSELTDELLKIFITLKLAGAISFSVIYAFITPPILKIFKKL